MPKAVTAGRNPGAGNSVGATEASSVTSRLWPKSASAIPATLARMPKRRELQHEQRERPPPRCAEAPEHRRGVEMATQVTRCGEGDRHGGQDHRDQRGEAQELFRPFQRLPHLRPQIANIFHPLAGRKHRPAAT